MQVDFVEQDAVVSLHIYVTQTTPAWGLSRISHKSRILDRYTYHSGAGYGVCVYIIDTGIFATHSVSQIPSKLSIIP